MKKLLVKIKLFFVIGWMAFTNPTIFNEDIFFSISNLLKMLIAIAKDKKPRMTHLAFVNVKNPDETENIVSVWAGISHEADPTQRIKELLEENAILSKQLTLAFDGLKVIKNWNDDAEDLHGDPGLFASSVLLSMKVAVVPDNISMQ